MDANLQILEKRTLLTSTSSELVSIMQYFFLYKCAGIAAVLHHFLFNFKFDWAKMQLHVILKTYLMLYF
jgi:hypothetical protein